MKLHTSFLESSLSLIKMKSMITVSTLKVLLKNQARKKHTHVVIVNFIGK